MAGGCIARRGAGRHGFGTSGWRSGCLSACSSLNGAVRPLGVAGRGRVNGPSDRRVLRCGVRDRQSLYWCVVLQVRLSCWPIQLRRVGRSRRSRSRARSREVCASCKTVDCIRGLSRTHWLPQSSFGAAASSTYSVLVQDWETSIARSALIACRPVLTRMSRSAFACQATNSSTTTGRSSLGRLSRRPDLGGTRARVHGRRADQRLCDGETGVCHGGVARRRNRNDVRVASCWGRSLFAALCVGPVILCGFLLPGPRAGMAGASRLDVRDIAMRYAYTLVPLGVGMWLAYSRLSPPDRNLDGASGCSECGD